MTFYCTYCFLMYLLLHFLHLFLLFLLLTWNKTQLNVCRVPPYQLINAEITNCCNYVHMYKNLSELQKLIRKTVIQSRVVVLKKKFFSLQVTIFNHRESFFSENSVSLFHESSCVQPLLNGYGIFQKSTCNHKLQTHHAFDRYFYLRCAAISKEHLQPYI